MSARRVSRDVGADVIVIGGGMVGLALACGLGQAGMRVTVVEREMPAPRRSLGRDCRVSAIVAGTADMLDGLGAWERVADRAEPIETMRVWDDQRDGGIRFEAAEAGLDALGYVVENSALTRALRDTLEAMPEATLLCPAHVADVRWRARAVEVTLEDGKRLCAPLVVGADGGRSWLRARAGIPVWSHRFGQQGIVATVRPALPHRRRAFQRFLPTGPLALLPLAGDMCSMVWSVEDEEAARLMALDDARFLDALQRAFGPVLGSLREVGRRVAFPLRSQLARHVVRPRLALVGDAAHQVHPLAGLGVNLGIRDAMVLAQEVADARRFGEDWGGMPVLERYLRARMPDVLGVLGGMEAFHHLFASRLPGVGWIRNAGMRLVGNAGVFKDMLMRRAMGLSLPVPRRIV